MCSNIENLYYQKPPKPKRRWFGKQKSVDEEFLPALAVLESTSAPPSEDVKLKEAEDHEQTKRANSVVSAAEAAVAAANAAAAEVVRFLHAARYHGKSTEEIAAIKIQAVCRGFLVITTNHSYDIKPFNFSLCTYICQMHVMIVPIYG